MGIGKTFSECFTFPVSNSEAKYNNILKGGGLVLLSIFIIPTFTLLGYGLRIREAAINGEEVPEMKQYGKLTKEGLYGFLALLPLSLGLNALLLASLTLTEQSIIIGGLLTVVSYLLIPYLIPAAFTIYAAERSWKQVYGPKTIDFAFNFDYLLGVFAYLIVAIVIGVITILAMFALLVPVLFAMAYGGYVRHSFWGKLYHETYNSKKESKEKETY